MYHTGPRYSDLQRFWSSVDIDESGCWLWTKALSESGHALAMKFGPERKCVRAARWAYENFIGAIPAGLELMALCRIRHCCNPHHHKPATRAEIVRAGRAANDNQHLTPHVPVHRRRVIQDCCARGHPYTPENTYIRPCDGKRRCWTCISAGNAKRRA